MTKNERFSPKTYIQTVLYDKVEMKRPRKRKTVSQEEFTILEFVDFGKILEVNFIFEKLKKNRKNKKKKK